MLPNVVGAEKSMVAAFAGLRKRPNAIVAVFTSPMAVIEGLLLLCHDDRRKAIEYPTRQAKTKSLNPKTCIIANIPARFTSLNTNKEDQASMYLLDTYNK